MKEIVLSVPREMEWKVYLCGFLSGSLGPPRHPENNA
jgi:hypothetical protein